MKQIVGGWTVCCYNGDRRLDFANQPCNAQEIGRAWPVYLDTVPNDQDNTDAAPW